ncbi:MAG: hypothetical protein Q8K99_14180 [Actinomycetota bacterium]|nr:hypothetical protein [Actinomycetota bacterium]
MADHSGLPASLTRFLLATIAAFWAAFAVLLLTDVVSIRVTQRGAVVLVAVLMLGNAAVMGMLAWLALRGRRFFDYAAVAVVAVNILLTVTDEVGAYDMAYLGVSIALLALLAWSMRASRRTGP